MSRVWLDTYASRVSRVGDHAKLKGRVKFSVHWFITRTTVQLGRYDSYLGPFAGKPFVSDMASPNTCGCWLNLLT